MEQNTMIETEQVKKLTIVEGIKYFFTNPNKLFESYNIKPAWLFKLLLIIALVCITAVITKEVTLNANMDLMLQQVQGTSKEQAEATAKFLNSPLMMGIVIGTAVLVTAAQLFLIPLIYYGLLSLFGAKTTYMKTVSVYMTAYIPVVIGGFVALAFAYYTNNYDGMLHPEMKDVLFDRLGFFVIWQALLLVFGFAKTASIKLSKAAAAVAIMWVITTGIQVGQIYFARGF
jgi:hypothetical protein